MKQSYYKIYSWMTDTLKLSGNELIIFAIIYSFHEKGKMFSGSLSYLEDKTNAARNTVIKSLKILSEMTFIIKQKSAKKGNFPNAYMVNIGHFDIHNSITNQVEKFPKSSQNLLTFSSEGSAKTAPQVVQNLHQGSAETAPQGSAETAPYIIIDNITNNITTTYKENEFVAVENFDFSNWKNFTELRKLIRSIHGDQSDSHALKFLHDELLEKGTILNDPKAFWKSKIIKGTFKR